MPSSRFCPLRVLLPHERGVSHQAVGVVEYGVSVSLRSAARGVLVRIAPALGAILDCGWSLSFSR
jgi:hypothetical protein